MNMNVGYLYNFNSYPPGSGGGVHVYNLAKNLRQLGCTIHTFDHEKNPECKVYPKTNEGIQNFLKSIDVLYVRIDQGLLSRNGLQRRCMEHRGTKPVVWEVNAPSDERLFAFKTESRSRCSLISFQTLKKYKHWATEILRVYREERYRRKYASGVSAAVCVSSQLRGYVVDELGIPQCTIIPNGADPSFFSPDKKSDVLFDAYRDFFKVIYVGDSRWMWQSFDLLSQLAAQARARRDKILFIVLNNAPRESIRTADNLLVFNRVNYSDVPVYLGSADACLCIYRDLSGSKYGFHGSSLKLFEYMSSGKPIIASVLGQISTVLEDGKDGLLTSNNVQDIYGKILFCSRHKEKAEEIGRAAREKVVRFYNWKRAAESTKTVFESVLG